jgi:hypothetical protein
MAERLKDFAANQRADDAGHNVSKETLAALIEYLARNETRDQANNEPFDDPHDILPF